MVEVQLAPGASESPLTPQVLVKLKSFALTPSRKTLVKWTSTLPSLVKVTVFPALLVPTSCSANVKPSGFTMTGTLPVPAICVPSMLPLVDVAFKCALEAPLATERTSDKNPANTVAMRSFMGGYLLLVLEIEPSSPMGPKRRVRSQYGYEGRITNKGG